jgi:uncharacterized protein (DUF697 family)
MALPIDVRDLYRFGKEITQDRDEPVRLAVLVEVDAPEALLDSVREALRPRTAQAFVDVEVIEATTGIPLAADAVIILTGSASARVADLVGELRSRVVPVVALALSPVPTSLDYELGLPTEDVLSHADPRALVDDELAGWLADRLSSKRLALASNFEFTRQAVAMEIVRTTALQNTLVGVVAIIPGTDMPIMTANQAKMLLQLATCYGQRIGSDRLTELAAVVGGGFAFRAVARQALTALPGFGWAIKGGIAYTGTMAMGRAAIAWFEEGADVAVVAQRVKDLGRSRQAEVEIEPVAVRDAEPEEPASDEPVQQTLQIDTADAGS